MIKILENDLSTSVKLNKFDKILGLVGENKINNRIFSFNKIFKGIDLSTDRYVVMLQIRPTHSEQEDFYVPLSKVVLENEVQFIWNITRECLVNSGNLLVNLMIKSVDEEEDIEAYSYILNFYVEPNLNANKSIEKIPKNVLEQYVIEAAAYANNSLSEANRAQQISEDMETYTYDILDRLYIIEQILGIIPHEEQDANRVLEAKGVIESMSFEMYSFNIEDIDSILNTIRDTILYELQHLNMQDIEIGIIENEYIPAIDESSELNDGADGRFNFMIELFKESINKTTNELSMIIHYKPYM